MMALYVSSHYKNSPNDLQLMADAPAHHLFVLLGNTRNLLDFLSLIYLSLDLFFKKLIVFRFFSGPVDQSSNVIPDILCVIQVSTSSLPYQF